MVFLSLAAVVTCTAVWALHASRRRRAADMGWMSGQWLAEYRARGAE